ncbi:MAG: hypothetical protein AB7U73_11785 [Pirellulales bacterium]
MSPTAIETEPQVDFAGRNRAARGIMRGVAGWCFFATCLLIPRFAWLRSPPYIEQAYCLWTEASFLAETDFDYKRLLKEERHADEGGHRAYMYSALATVIAILLRLLPPADAFLAYRLFTIGCGATVLWIVFQILRPRAGLPIALLIALAVATVPLFSVQVEMLGLDLPMVAIASICLWAVDRGRFVLAAFLTLPAFAMKNSAFLISGALCAYLMLSLSVGARDVARFRALRRGLLASLALCVFEVALLFAGDNARTRMHVPRSSDLYLWLASAPDVLLTTLCAAGGTLALYTVIVGRLRRTEPALRFWQVLGRAWTLIDVAYGPIWFAWILSLFSMAMILPVFFECRYLCLPVVCLYLSLGLLCGGIAAGGLTSFKLWPGHGQALCCGGLGLLICLNLANQFGLFYPRLPLQMARGWGTLERSLEYRADHEANISTTRVLAESAGQAPILVTDWFVHFVTVPQLGYVERSLAPADWKRRFDAHDNNLRAWLLDDAPVATLVHVHPQRSLAFPALCIAEPGPDDELLFDDHFRPPVTVFRRTWSGASDTPQGLRERLDAITADAVGLDPAARLLALGWADLACRWLATETGRPNDDSLRGELLARTQAARQQASAMFAGEALDRLNQRLDFCERYLRDATRPLSELPPATLEDRGLTIELPQRALYLPADDAIPQSR